MDKKLHWTQRVALVQHSLHMAGLSRDFTFFKHLQAQGLIERTDHAAVLDHLLNEDDDAVDVITLNMDKFNAVIACVYEDAFKNAYGSVNACVRDQQAGRTEGKALFRADLIHQKQMADESIDKMLSLAVDMIKKQPARSQDAAADVLIRGATFTADAMEVCLKHMDALEKHMDDSGHLEDSWTIVQSAVGLAVSAMKGVFNLMASTPEEMAKESETEEERKHTRSQSVDGYARLMLRRMSTALAGAPPPTPTESPRSGSTSSWASALSRRSSISSLFSSSSNVFTNNDGNKKASSYGQKGGGTLSPIPATPLGTAETLRDPFETAFANESAFASNTVADDDMDPADPAPSEQLQSRRSSDNIAPGDTSAPKPEPRDPIKDTTTATTTTTETQKQATQARKTSPPGTRSPAPSPSPPTSYYTSPRTWSGPLSARSLLSRASIPPPINTNIESNTKPTATRYGPANTTAASAKPIRSSAADRYSPTSRPSERSASFPTRNYNYNPTTATSDASSTHPHAVASTSTSAFPGRMTSTNASTAPSRSESVSRSSSGAGASALPLPANALRAHPPTLPSPNLSMNGMRRRSANLASGSHPPKSLERLFDEIV